jgi:hypothetical protein
MAGHEILVALYIASIPLTMGSLLNALDRSRLPALLAFPLAYNLPFHYGFVSFAFSLPVLVLLLAQLARLLISPEQSWGRWSVSGCVAVLLFLCHLQNFVYGVCAAVAFVLFSGVPWRRRLTSLAAFLPAVSMMVYWQLMLRPDTRHRPRGLAYAWKVVTAARLREVPRARWPWLQGFQDRVVSVPENALRAFADRSEVAACHALLLLVLFYFCVAVTGRYLLPLPMGNRPRMRISTWVAFFGALMAYVLLPHHLNEFDIVTLFPRFAPLVVLLTLPLVPRGLLHFPVSVRTVLTLPALVFGVAWGLQLVQHYQVYARETADFRALVNVMEPGRKAIGMPFDRRSRVMRIESAFLGLANFYPVLKPAPGSMVPLMYCDMLHMPCVKKPLAKSLPDPSPWSPDRLDMEQAVKFYDYFLIRSPPRDVFGKQGVHVELVMHRGQWWLWRRKGS